MDERAPSPGPRSGRGAYVVIAGPDGSGKSTLAGALIDHARGRFRGMLHLHWRPGVLPRPGSLVGVESGDPTAPHAREPHGRLLSLGLLGYHWLDFFLGTWSRILPMKWRGGLIVVERGWMDIGVDPRRYHLDVPGGLVEVLARLLPAPDLVVLLQADAVELHKRKAELPPAELRRQLDRWRRIRFPRRTRRLVLDASLSPEQLVATILSHLPR